MPILMVERGNDKGLNARVEPSNPVVVGRENDRASIKLTDPMASRAHFQILGVNGTWKIRDMKSRNGTLLNDERLPPDAEREIRIGDKIQVGETIFSFLSDAKEESPGGGLIGKTIGGYQILERVGRGGMGTVYKAEQISLKRVVALKVLSAKLLSDPVFVERFVQEARAAGGLTHPNIVQVIDVGSDRGIYYFSMEFMDHGSVGDIVAKDGPVPWERALEMLTDAAKGLIFAEKKGIIHRDIKPDNLMLTAEGTVKIGDLGLAKKADDAAGEGGQIFGTPHFIAPEQAQGKPVDHRADLYALGATFYRVFTGRTPFSGENVKEILLKQIQEEPKPIQNLAPDLPDEIVAVVGKLMRKRPDDRYRSAQGLFEDLESIRVRYHLEAHGQAASARRSKFIAVVAGLGALALAGVAYHYATQPERVRTVEIPGQNGNAGNQGSVAPTVPPEILAGNEALAAFNGISTAELALRGRLNGKGPAESWSTNEEDWLGIAKRYASLAEKYAKFPSLRPVLDAVEKDREIREAIDGAKKAWDIERTRLSKALSDALLEIDALVPAHRFAEAAAKLEAMRTKGKPPLLSEAAKEFLKDEAAKAFRERKEALGAASEARVALLLKSAADGAPVFPGKAYLDARAGLLAAIPGLEPAETAKDEVSVRLREHVARIRGAVEEGDAKARGAAAAALDADRGAFVGTYLSIRRWNPEGDPLPEETPFFDFRWDGALGSWEALAGTLRTKPWRERAALKIMVYRRCKRLFETIGELLRSRGIREASLPGNRFLDNTQEAREKATSEGVHVLRMPGRTKEFLEFRALTPGEVYEHLLRKGEGVPLSSETRIDLAVFLAEAGLGGEAWQALGPVPNDEKLRFTKETGLGRWITIESATANEYYGPDGIGGRMALYLKDREAGTKSAAELEATRKIILDRIEATLARESWYTTDFSILCCSERGGAPAKMLRDSEVEEILRTLGVEGAEGIPAAPPEDPEDPPPPPPPPTNGSGGGDGADRPADPPPADGAGGGSAKDPGDPGGNGTEKPK